jgi:hypothetical protein
VGVVVQRGLAQLTERLDQFVRHPPSVQRDLDQFWADLQDAESRRATAVDDRLLALEAALTQARQKQDQVVQASSGCCPWCSAGRAGRTSGEPATRFWRNAALGGTFAGAAIAPTTAGFAAPKDVPPDLAAYFATQLAGHYAADTRLGARPLLDTVVAQHRVLSQAAAVAAPGSRVELLRMDVAFAGLAGWLCQDMGDRLRAWHCYCEALELAHRADDPDLVAYALANMSSLRLDAGEGPGSASSQRPPWPSPISGSAHAGTPYATPPTPTP